MGMQYDSDQIAEILPHRYPFALVDRIVDGEPGKWARGIKCVTVNGEVAVTAEITFAIQAG